MDYAKNLKYFRNSKIGLLVFGIILAVFGVILTVNGISNYEDGLKTLGIIMLVIGIVLSVIAFIGRPISDSEYDKSIQEAISTVKKDALENLDLDESEVNEVEPIQFGCFNFDTFNNIKEGKDKIIRTDRYLSVVVYPTQNELNVYEYDFSTTEEFKKKKGTIYFYKDIVSIEVSTITRSISDMKNKKFTFNNSSLETSVTYEKLQIVTKGGSTLTINLMGEDDSVKSLRALLKENKRS